MASGDAAKSSSAGNKNEKKLQVAARKAAIAIQEEFDTHSGIRNAEREEAVPVYDPEEVMLMETTHEGGICTITKLKGISLRYNRNPPFDDEMEDHREHFADRSHDEHYVLKSTSHRASTESEETAVSAAVSLMIETLILANLAKHPHICQLYGINSSGADAPFGCHPIEHGFFIITDRITETLPERMQAWRAKKGYEGQRYDGLAARQSQLTQRLEVAMDICSAVLFCSDRKLVYHLHPEKVGFDSRYGRIKLFHFCNARETDSMPLQQHYASTKLLATKDMWIRAYLAPEVLTFESVTVSADVYAMGMLIWEMLTLRHPCDGMSLEEHMKNVIVGNERPRLNSTWPVILRKLIEACWSPTERPLIKDVYSKLEESLLFQDLDGIDQTEDHSMRSSVTKTKRISYKPKSEETIPEEERDRDVKSVRSHRSQKSHDTTGSSKSKQSNGSDDSGKVRPPRDSRTKPQRAKSVDTFPIAQKNAIAPNKDEEEGNPEKTTKKNSENQGSPRKGGMQRAASVRVRGTQASRKIPQKHSTRNLREEPEESPEMSALEKAAAPSFRKSRKIVYKKDGPMSTEERDRDSKSTKSARSQRSQETSTSGKSKSTRGERERDGTSRSGTHRKSESSRRTSEEKSSPRTEHQKSESSRRTSEEKSSPRTESSTKVDGSRKIVYQKDKPMTAEERDRDAKSTRSHTSHRSEDSSRRHSQRSRTSTSDDSATKPSSQRSRSTDKINDHRSQSAGEVANRISSPRSPYVDESGGGSKKTSRTHSAEDINTPNLQQLSDADESGDRPKRQSRHENKSRPDSKTEQPSDDNVRPRSKRGESSRKLTRQTSTRKRSETAPDRQRSKRDLRRERSTRLNTSRQLSLQGSDDDANPPSSHRTKERVSRRRSSSKDNSIVTESNNDEPQTPRISSSGDETFVPLKDNSSPIQGDGEESGSSPSGRRRSRLSERESDEEGRGRGRTAPTTRRVHRSRSGDQAKSGEDSGLATSNEEPGDKRPVPSRGVSRHGSGTDDAIAAHSVGRGAPSARRILRHKSSDGIVPKSRFAPSTRRVSRAKSDEFDPASGVVWEGAGADGGEKLRTPVSRTSTKPKRSMSTRDIKFAEERRSFIEERMTISMSDHSKWEPFQPGDNGEEEHGNGSNEKEQKEVARPEGALKPSGKDNPRSNRSRIVKEAKEAKLAAEESAQAKEKNRKEAYSKAVVAATQQDGRKAVAKHRSSQKSRKSLNSTDLTNDLLKLAAEDWNETIGGS